MPVRLFLEPHIGLAQEMMTGSPVSNAYYCQIVVSCSFDGFMHSQSTGTLVVPCQFEFSSPANQDHPSIR